MTETGFKEHVKEIHIATGFNGQNWVNSTTEPQFRRGASVVVHFGYYAQNSQYHHAMTGQEYDIAAIRLETPFEQVESYSWESTPIEANEITIRVIGYPSDLPIDEPEEKGNVMFSAGQRITYKLGGIQNRLAYKLDTYSGG